MLFALKTRTLSRLSESFSQSSLSHGLSAWFECVEVFNYLILRIVSIALRIICVWSSSLYIGSYRGQLSLSDLYHLGATPTEKCKVSSIIEKWSRPHFIMAFHERWISNRRLISEKDPFSGRIWTIVKFILGENPQVFVLFIRCSFKSHPLL